MRYLVVGASGFVGRNVLAHLRARGFEATGTQSRSRQPDLVTFDLLQDRIVERVGRDFFERPGRIEVILCAVVSDMDRCLLDRERSRRINVENMIRLIDDVRVFGARVTFLSTCFVFDGTIGYYREEDPISPVNEYARHKVEVEHYLAARAPEAFVARLDKIVGDDPGDAQLFAHWHRRIVEGQPIVSIAGSVLSPTYVRDVAEAMVASARLELRGIYHVANPEFFHRHELAFQFSRAMGRTPNVLERPLADFRFADGRALKSYLDGSRFARVTGLRFTPMREVFEAFRRRLEAEAAGEVR